MPNVLKICLLCVLCAQALAGPLDEAKAQAHLKAIAAADFEAVMRDYSEDAYMDWIGGPLDGRYRGKAAIAEVWKKFFAANAGQARTAKFGPLKAYANSKGTSLEVVGDYGGVTPVKAWQVFSYREGNLNTEIWQITPVSPATVTAP